MLTLFFVYLFILGAEAPAIVNGIYKATEPNRGEFPYHASLMLLHEKQYHNFCGGSLIHPRWILTAAHCIQLDENHKPVKAQGIYVALGSVFRNPKNAQILRAERTVIHPLYLQNERHDIALIKLKTAAKLGPNVKLIKLHTNSTDDLLGQTAFLTGFGITNDFNRLPDKLRKATLHISPFSNCFNEEEFQDIEICATSTMAEGKACRGDSGGPLVIQKNGRLVQVGVTSHLAVLPFCRFQFNNSVYTKVAAYVNWLAEVTGLNFNTYPY